MDYTIKSLIKALEIIELLAEHPATAKEIADRLKMNKSTLHRFLNTLEHQYYIEQTTTNKYRLAQKFIQLGLSAQNHIEVTQVAKPFLLELTQEFGECALLAGFDNQGVFYMVKEESPFAVRIVLEPGRRVPCHTVASGKLFLSYLSEVNLKKYVEKNPLIVSTENTIIDEHVLMKELKKIRQQGYAVDNEEFELGLRGLAVPIFNHDYKMCAALCVAGVAMRINEDKINAISTVMIEMGKKISKQLGFQGNSSVSNQNIKRGIYCEKG